MSPRSVTESEFQGWLAGGEYRRAAEWLVLRYADDVMGMCVAVVRDHSTAEDLVQDVFSRAFVGLKGFRAEASSRTWLLKITRNRCFDHLRAKQRQPWGAGHPDATIEPDDIPEEAPMPAELLSRRADVEAALGELAEGDRALIVLRFRSGLDYSELAVAFGLKPGTVRMRVSRALARMRRALEQREARARAELAPAEDELAPLEEVAELEELDEELAADIDEPRAPDFAPAPPARRPAPPRAPAPFAATPSLGAGPRRAAPGLPPPGEHPLSAFFAATQESLPGALRERLLDHAQQL